MTKIPNMKSEIIYISGFPSATTPQKSRTYQFLQNSIDDNSRLYCVEYSPSNPTETINTIDKLLKSFFTIRHTDIILVGNSLGGFYANIFKNKYDLRTILINPSLFPHITLSQKVSTKALANYAEIYHKYQTIKSTAISEALIGENDEVIDIEKTVEYLNSIRNLKIVYTKDSHRFQSFDILQKHLTQLENLCLDE